MHRASTSPTHHLTRHILVTAAVVAAALLPSSPASAGGPTSVLLVSPMTGSTASLYATDDDYGLLMQALGESPVADGKGLGLNAGPGHNQVNITWLVHDVAVWRTDHVVMSATDGPWVQTRISYDGATGYGDPGTWHRGTDPALLVDLLTKLGVLGGTGGKAAAAPQPALADSVPQSVADSAAQPAPAAAAAWYQWALPTLLAGVLIGAAGRPAAARLARVRSAWRPAS